MINWRVFLLSLFALLSASASDTHTVSGNVPRDLYGPVDIRMPDTACYVGPCIWGHADSENADIQFYPQSGFRVRILAIRGDLVSWIKTQPGDAATPLESAAGVLAGFETTSSNGSVHCNYCADNVAVYIQDSVSEKQPKSRAGFNYDDVDMLLDADNVLNFKIAAWLNTTGKPIHLELTYTIKFAYEPVPPQTDSKGVHDELRRPSIKAR
jgi:hypothetical protein